MFIEYADGLQILLFVAALALALEDVAFHAVGVSKKCLWWGSSGCISSAGPVLVSSSMASAAPSSAPSSAATDWSSVSSGTSSFPVTRDA
jgi:hypothetical protein